MVNKAGELGEGQDVKDFEYPGICICSVSYRLLPEGFKQLSDVIKSFFFGRMPEHRGTPLVMGEVNANASNWDYQAL